MRRGLKRKWVNTLLRNYRQGKGYLKQKRVGEKDYRFSVLGVLEDMYIEQLDYERPEPLATWYEHTDEEGNSYWTRGANEHKLSVETAKWAKIPCNPVLTVNINGKSVRKPISVLNDDHDFSFKDFVKPITEQL